MLLNDWLFPNTTHIQGSVATSDVVAFVPAHGNCMLLHFVSGRIKKRGEEEGKKCHELAGGFPLSVLAMIRASMDEISRRKGDSTFGIL